MLYQHADNFFNHVFGWLSKSKGNLRSGLIILWLSCILLYVILPTYIYIALHIAIMFTPIIILGTNAHRNWLKRQRKYKE